MGGQLETVQYLLATHRPLFDVIDSEGRSVFWAACFSRNLDLVKLTYSEYLKKFPGYREPFATLATACLAGCHADVVSYLINENHDVNARHLSNQTALHIAAAKGHTQVVEMLVKAGAEQLKDDYGLTPIETAAAAGQEKCLEYFVNNLPHNYSDKFLREMRLLVAAGKLLKDGEDSNSFVLEAVGQLEKNSDNICTNYPFKELRCGKTCLMEPGELRDIKRALVIYQQVLGMGNPYTISAFRKFVQKQTTDRCWSILWYAELFECLSENLRPLDDQLIISLGEYLIWLRSDQAATANGFPGVITIVHILLSEMIRGNHFVHKTAGFYSDKTVEILFNAYQRQVAYKSKFKKLLLHFLRIMRTTHKSADDVLQGWLFSPCTWMVQNLTFDPEWKTFMHVWLDDAVEETDHTLFTGVLKLISNMGKNNAFASAQVSGYDDSCLLDLAINLKHSNVEIVSYLLEHSRMQPKVTQQLFATITQFESINRADVALRLKERVSITEKSAAQLCTVFDDISPIVQFAEIISDKSVLTQIAAACLEKNKLVEAMKLFKRCGDFSHHSAFFEKALKDDSYARWNELAEFLTSALQIQADPGIEKELVAVNRMAAIAISGDPRERPPSDNVEDHLCVLCYAQEKDVVLVPCGHTACCRPCSEKVSTCPFCSAVITNRQRFFRT